MDISLCNYAASYAGRRFAIWYGHIAVKTSALKFRGQNTYEEPIQAQKQKWAANRRRKSSENQFRGRNYLFRAFFSHHSFEWKTRRPQQYRANCIKTGKDIRSKSAGHAACSLFDRFHVAWEKGHEGESDFWIRKCQRVDRGGHARTNLGTSKTV